MKIFDKKDKSEDADPECVMDILISSEVYNRDLKKITNDLMMAMIGAADTSRNTIVIMMCHFARNKASKDRVI